jgi:hypothetical protein
MGLAIPPPLKPPTMSHKAAQRINHYRGDLCRLSSFSELCQAWVSEQVEQVPVRIFRPVCREISALKQFTGIALAGSGSQIEVPHQIQYVMIVTANLLAHDQPHRLIARGPCLRHDTQSSMPPL